MGVDVWVGGSTKPEMEFVPCLKKHKKPKCTENEHLTDTFNINLAYIWVETFCWYVLSDNWIQSSAKRVAYDYNFEEKRLSYDGTHISYCILIDLLGWTYLKSIVLLLVADLPDATVFQQSKIRVQSNSILMCLCQAKEYTNTKPWQRKTTVT